MQEPDEQGNTALHLAALGKNSEMIKVLMAKISVKRTNKEGLTPLHIAAGNGIIEGVRALLENEDAKSIINLEDISGRAPLLLASSSGSKDVVSLLLKNGASLRCRNKYNESALHFCARFGHASVISLLTQKLEQEKDVFREPLKNAYSLRNQRGFPSWARANRTKPLERLVTKGGTQVRLFLLYCCYKIFCRLSMHKTK